MRRSLPRGERPGPPPVAPSVVDAARRRHTRRLRFVLAAVLLSIVLMALAQAGLLPLAPVDDVLGGAERALTGGSARDLREVTAERDRLALDRTHARTSDRAAGDIAAARALDVLDGARLLPARIIAWDRGTAATDRRVTIDVGALDGVPQGAAVVSGDGLAGRVVTVSRWTSEILLVGDAGVTVSARVGPGGALAAVSTGRLGQPDSSARLTVTAMVPGTLHPGDEVVTTGSEPYPAGLRIGTVGRLDPASGQVAGSAELVPAVDVARLGVVSVVVAPPRAAPRPTVTAAR